MLSLESYKSEHRRLKMKICYDGHYRIETGESESKMNFDSCSLKQKTTLNDLFVKKSRVFEKTDEIVGENDKNSSSIKATSNQKMSPKPIKRKRPVRRGEWTVPKSRKRRKMAPKVPKKMKTRKSKRKLKKKRAKLLEKLQNLVHARVFASDNVSTSVVLQQSVETRKIERLFLPNFDQYLDEIMQKVQQSGCQSKKSLFILLLFHLDASKYSF